VVGTFPGVEVYHMDEKQYVVDARPSMNPGVFPDHG
jgi:hypothetical protein